jgi:DivIVA domain-containing protein
VGGSDAGALGTSGRHRADQREDQAGERGVFMYHNPKLQQLLQKEGISFTALDVHNQSFDKGRMFSRRFDAQQVDGFLDRVVKDYENFYKLLGEMQLEIEALNEVVANKGEISIESLHVRVKKIEHSIQMNK